MKSITDMQNSDNILDRQKYAKWLKDVIDKVIQDIAKMESWEPTTLYQESEDNPHLESLRLQNEITKLMNEIGQSKVEYLVPLEKKLLRKLKDRLSAYDIYNQKTPYLCPNCREQICVCKDAGIQPVYEVPEEPQPTEPPEPEEKLFQDKLKEIL